MITFVIAIAAVLGLVLAPVNFDFVPVIAERKNPSHHLVLAEGVRNQELVGGDVTGDARLPIRRNRYVPPRKISESDFITPLSGESAIVVDVASNEVLFAKNIDSPHAIASITKLMSALVVLSNNTDLDAQVVINESDIRTGRQYVYPGERVTVRELFRASLIGSSNSATVALARSTGLDEVEFVARMNQKAKAMGLTQTYFEEPTGLDHDNVSTARELVVLLRFAMENDMISDAVGRNAYTMRFVNGVGRTIYATNWLLTGQVKRVDDAKVVGGKTGYNDAAGYNFMTHYKDNGNPIAVVVLGADDHYARFTEADMLSRWVYDSYAWVGDKSY